jgi:hypothetical protein
MVQVFQDAMNPGKVAVSATVTVWIDAILFRSLSDELEKAIRHQAIKDLKHNPEVKKAIAEAASKKLLSMLGVEEQVVSEENHEQASASTSINSGQSISQDRGSLDQ